ncbi:hypothetical protein BIU82_13475 [Arthrobacter sp. SW1]|uniref:WD40 repeat domain-containing protein n=1 Tax=Arthrobacter sp. SW1 TaxID=1920889 RepID=UPI000877B90D|nr:WD40 repeat domain-containing protein [Arthrobacter sp. SW1]OFI36503.1 hypothetical protein BIU82_13475 [Arthrobacter sp. SW1]
MRVVWEAPLADRTAALAASTAAGRVAVAGVDGTLQLRSLANGSLTAQPDADVDSFTDVTFSPDGRSLAATGVRGYLLYGVEDGGLQRFAAGWCTRAAYADDGRLAVAAGRRLVVHAPDGSLAWQPDAAGSTITGVTWLARQREVAVSGYGGVEIYARHSKRPVHGYRYGGSHLAVAAASTGRWICTGNQDATVHVWKTQGKLELHMPGYPRKVTQLGFDPTGRWLANNGSRDLTVWDFGGESPAGSKPRLLSAHEGIEHFAWRDCRVGIVASAGTEGSVAIWGVERMLPGMPGKPLASFDPGGAVRVQWLGLDRLLVATEERLMLVDLEL